MNPPIRNTVNIIANKLKSMTNNNLKKTLTNLGINISNDYKEDNND